jgi:hypothetical protein
MCKRSRISGTASVNLCVSVVRSHKYFVLHYNSSSACAMVSQAWPANDTLALFCSSKLPTKLLQNGKAILCKNLFNAAVIGKSLRLSTSNQFQISFSCNQNNYFQIQHILQMLLVPPEDGVVTYTETK